MASAGSGCSSFKDCLKPTQDKTNFIRLTRLLICGGTKVIRELFDFTIPARHLAMTLNDPTVLSTLQVLRKKRILKQHQWNILYPSPGVVVESTSFDITLLFMLLREICGFTAPVTGWDKLPNTTDTTLEADLARIKYYRNTVYAHDNNDMEISDGDFQNYWKEIEAALLRIVASYSPLTVADCEKEIKDCLHAPITDADERNVEELKLWYSQDIDLKSIVSSMSETLEEMRSCQRERGPGLPEIIAKCVVKLATTGAWIIGSAFIFNRYMDDPEILKTLVHNVVLPTGMVVVVAILRGSIKVVLRVAQLNALEELWKRYQTGRLRRDFEKVLITDELRQLAKGVAVEIEIFVSDEEYERAREFLASKNKEGHAETKIQLSKSDEDDDEFVMVNCPPGKPEVRTINGLVTADLTNYDLVTVFPDFTAINNLQVIRMPSHSLEDIPGEDSKIPNSFCSMKYLKKVCLFGDNLRIAGLTRLPRDFGCLQSLEELNLQHNSFSVFPEQICQLKNLKKLYLNSCGLTSISTNISSLINLLEADFSQNDFSGGLPIQLFDLPRLKDLYLIECRLDHLPPEIGNLKQLEGIRLNDNFLKEFPDEFFNLIHLKKLSANNNRISKLSSKTINLQELRVLLLKENNLTLLPEEISKLLNLQLVNVFYNKLTCLPETITEMQSSMQFNVHGNEYLQQPPLSVCTKGIDSIKGYFESLKEERPVHSNRIKIVMFGEAGAGKTCLTKALVRSQATDCSEDDSTIGAEIHHWKIEPYGLEACIVDLAGQRRYQHTHPFFLSEEALHILVVNLKKYQCTTESFKENVEDWIEWVTARLLKPRIMVVPAHKDECEEKEVTKKCMDILERIKGHEKREIKRLDAEMKKLQKKRCPLKEKGIDVEAELENLRSIKNHRPIISSKLLDEENKAKSKNVKEDGNYITIVPVSSKEELHGVIPLKEEIKRVAKVKDLFPFIGRDLPPSWVALEEAIKKYTQDIVPPNVPCMTLKDFQQFAFIEAQLSGIQVLSVLKYLDSVGEIKFYGKIGTDQYSVFLDLQWLCKTVKCLFRHDIPDGVRLEYQEEYQEYDMEEIKFDQHVNDLIANGVLSFILLRCIWKELKLDEEEFQRLIKAFICFGLACELPLSHPDGEKKLLIPWFLHYELSQEDKEKIFPSTPGPGSSVTEYKLRYSICGYLPAGLFDRLCVHSFALGADVCTWKNSMLIYLDGDIKIFLEVQGTYITVTGRTGSRSNVNLWSGLLKIVEDLDSLLKEWPGVVWNTYTVCPHCVKNKESKPHHFECKWLLAQGPQSQRCSKSKLKKILVNMDSLVPPEDLLRRIKSPKHVPEIVSDSLITQLSRSLATDWKTLASNLSLSNDEIALIDANETRVEEKTNAMLQKWKNKNGSDATRSRLIKGLEKTDRADLIEEVNKHQDD